MATIREHNPREDNRFDILRLIAAWLVLFSHCYPLGGRDAEPLMRLTGVDTFGAVGVAIFFALSGYLVTQSLSRSGSLLEFARRRALRIFPALAVVCLLAVFVLGPLMTTRALSDYFSQRQTWGYLRAISAVSVPFNLPGVFETHKVTSAVNGSLWSLPYEIRCYIALAILSVLPLSLRLKTLLLAIALAAMQAVRPQSPPADPSAYFFGIDYLQNRLGLTFMVGAIVALWGGRWPRWLWHATGVVAVLVLFVAWRRLTGQYQQVAWTLALSWIVLWLAFHARWLPRVPARMGDWSYGVYLYAFPVQQVLTEYGLPQKSFGLYVLASTVISFALAALSWFLVEKPALRLKNVGNLDAVSRRMYAHFKQVVTREHPWRGMPLAIGTALGVGLLAIQNVIMFRRHYARDLTFPWDFLGPYHAVPYYWIEAVQHGASVAWIPFQGMGYPLYLNFQSGFFYPPLWVVALLHKTYLFHAATVIQGLHVLLGAAGAALCARLLGMRWSLVLLAGVMYQCFGGFYSNASHPDIVRAYAWLPWLCAPVFALWERRTGLLAFALSVLPAAVYMLCTGGYSGAVVSVLFVLGMVVLARMALALRAGTLRRPLLTTGFLCGAGLVTGCVMAAVALLPATLDRLEVARIAFLEGLAYDYFGLKDVFAFAFRVNSPFFDHDVTMRSVFVGFVALALVLLRFSLGHARQGAVLLGAGVLALAMATGLLHKPLAVLLAPLGYSRFTLADYRGFIGLTLVLGAVQALQLLADGVRPARRWRYAWVVLLLAYAGAGLALVQGGALPGPLETAALAIVLPGAIAALLWAQSARGLGTPGGARAWRGWRQPALVAALMAITLLDWARVVWEAPYFSVPGGQASIEAQIGPFTQTREALAQRLLNPPPCRPERVDISVAEPAKMPWRGYYTGEYMTQDYSGPINFVRQRLILTNPPLAAFGRKAWTAVALRITTPPTVEQLVTAPPAGMACVRYATTHLEYAIDLAEPALVVENEIYWPGWSARIDGTKIQAVEVQGFRGWHLPAGRYEMRADFDSPHLKQGILVSLGGLLMWLVLIALVLVPLWRQRRRPQPV